MIENLRRHIPAVCPSTFRAVNPVAGPDICEQLESSVGHEDRSVTGLAVRARMAASAVRVDRPAEREHRRRRDLVDDRAGVDVEELHAAELALADVALDFLFEEGALTGVVLR